MFVPYHQHILVKAYVERPFTAIEETNSWLKRLVEKVGMVVVAGPTSVRVEEVGNAGVTGTVTLATSHASIHIWEDGAPPMLQFDLYSCKSFSAEAIIEHLGEMGIVRATWIMVDRNKDDLIVSASGKV